MEFSDGMEVRTAARRLPGWAGPLPGMSRVSKRLRQCLVGVWALALSGCALFASPPPPEPTVWEQRQEVFANIDRWLAAGRFSVTYAGETTSGLNFTWDQSPQATDVFLSGPLGIGEWRLQGVPGGQLTIRGGGETTVLTDPEPELLARLGFPMPVLSLSHWLLGLPDPAHPHAYVFGEDGWPAQLQQRGWTVEYRDWRAYPGGWWLPRRIELHAPDVRTVVLLDNWAPTAR